MKVCKNCGAINKVEAEHCANCGMDVFNYSEEVTCLNCGATNDKSYTHCVNCGAVLKHTDSMPIGAVDIRQELAEEYRASLLREQSEEATACPNCGEKLPVNAVFCYRCGTPIAKLTEHKIVSRKICPHCGRPNPIANPYCSYCYRTLADAQTQNMQVVHETKQVGDFAVSMAMLENEHGKKKICDNCGALNDEYDDFCYNCGLKLDVEVRTRYCNNCGAENSVDSKFCVSCQCSLEPYVEQITWKCNKCGTDNDASSVYCINCGNKK